MLLLVYLCSPVFVSSLRSFIIFIRRNFRSESCFSGIVRVSRFCSGRTNGLWWCQGALVSVAYVLMIASHHLVISGVNCPWCLWVDLVHPVSLWAWLWCRSWESRCLWVWESACCWEPPSHLPLQDGADSCVLSSKHNLHTCRGSFTAMCSAFPVMTTGPMGCSQSGSNTS